MTAFRAHRRLHAWLAACVLLLAACAPAVSHALAAASPWDVVCSAPAGDDTPTHAAEHCPACLLQHAACGLPPADAVPPQAAALADHRPPAFLAAPRTLHAWRHADPRGPPVFA